MAVKQKLAPSTPTAPWHGKKLTAARVPTVKALNAYSKTSPLTAVSLFSGMGGGCLGLKMAGFDVRYANEFIPVAADCYDANSSITCDRHDVRQVTSKRIYRMSGIPVGEIDLVLGSPPCFIAGTLVQTEDGGFTPIEKLQVGQNVLTHKNRMKHITTVMQRRYAGTLYTVKSAHGEPITATPEHPFYIRSRTGHGNNAGGWKKGVSAPMWIPAERLRTGDYVCVGSYARPSFGDSSTVVYKTRHPTTGALIAGKKVDSLPLDKTSFWYIVGRWLGDGWCRDILESGRKPRSTVIICCDNTDGGAELKEITSRLDQLKLSYGVQEHRTSNKILFGNREWVNFLRRFGKGAAGKFIPSEVYGLDKHLKKSLLRGYIEADGCKFTAPKNKFPTFRYSSISANLAYGIAHLAAQVFNVGVRIDRNDNNTRVIEGRAINAKPIYTGSFKTKRDEQTHTYVDEGGLVWAPIRTIETRRTSGTNVYNISVEGDETYTANGVVVHNCKAFSSAQARKGGSDFGKIIPYSEGVKQRVDDLFFEFCRLLKKLQPKAFLAENVPGLVKAINRGYFVEIHAALTACGYNVQAVVIDPSRYGIPQRRNRLIFQGIRNDLYEAGVKHAWPKPYESATAVNECLPHIVQIKTANGFTWANVPCSTITAADHSIGITGDFSAGGFVETADGTRRKYTIDELKVISSVPKDFVFPRQPNETDRKHFIRSWERLGRILLPLFAYHLGMAVRQNVIEPSYKLTPKKSKNGKTSN